MPRLDAILKEQGLRSAEVRDALKWGKVFVDGVPSGYAGRQVTADRVELRRDAPRIRPGRDVVFLHTDKHLVVCWKPPGLLSVPAPRRGGHKSVLGLVRRSFGAGFAVHRLDEQTSGLMMVARTEECQERTKRLLERHDVERRYLALAHGRLGSARRVESVFVRDRGDGRRGSAPEDAPPPDGGKRAVTHLVPLEVVSRSVQVVGARLETGRTHQVRIHLAEQGCPVLGDPLYANAAIKRKSPRLALHAYALGLRHPMTHEALRFTAPMPDDLLQVWANPPGRRPRR